MVISQSSVEGHCAPTNAFTLLRCPSGLCFSSQQAAVLSRLSLQLFTAAAAVSDIVWAGLQPLSSKPWGQCTSHNFSPTPDPLHWDVLQPISFLRVPLYQRRTLNICKLRATVISMPRSTGTPVFSYESNFLEQSSTSECEINVSFALMFMLSIPLRETGW